MPRLTAQQIRNRTEWDVELEPGWSVHVRRLDLVTAFLKNLIPMPLMAALDRLQERSKTLEADPASIMSTPEEDKLQTLELMQRYACAAITDPIFVMEDDQHPDHVPVSLLTSDQLLLIWQSGPMKDKLPEVSPATAEAFRERLEQEQSAAPVSHEPQVSPAPEFVSPVHTDGHVEIRYH